MAGQSGHNLKIAKSKLGCRFPFESPNAGDGYAASGPCLVRQMTPKEKARYGPAVAPKDRDLRRGEAAFAVDNATSLEHAAKMARVSVARMKREMARHCIAVPEGWKEDETVNDIKENMDSVGRETPEAPENKDTDVFDKNLNPDSTKQEQKILYKGSPHSHGFTVERIARAEQALSREEYIRLKGENTTDQSIIKDYKLSSELLITLKKKWGVKDLRLDRYIPRKKASTKPLEEPKEEPRAQATASGLTIAQALELRDELTEDMKSWDVIHRSIIQGIELSARVVRILEGQRDIHQTALNRINEAFENTVLPL